MRSSRRLTERDKMWYLSVARVSLNGGVTSAKGPAKRANDLNHGRSTLKIAELARALTSRTER